MNLGRFLDRLVDIVGRGAPAEVDSDGVGASTNTDHGWRLGEEGFVFGEVADSEGCRHNDETERLERWST